MTKYSAWFPGDVAPVRPGVYQRLWTGNLISYALWSGQEWRVGSTEPFFAALEWLVSPTQLGCTYWWRGLAHPTGDTK